MADGGYFFFFGKEVEEESMVGAGGLIIRSCQGEESHMYFLVM